MTSSILGAVGSVWNVTATAVHSTSLIVDNVDTAAQVAKLFYNTINAVNLKLSTTILTKFADTMGVVNEFANARSWVDKVNQLMTWNAFGWGTYPDSGEYFIRKSDAMYIEGRPIPNLLKGMSTICLLISDIGTTMVWLDKMEFLRLGQLATSIGQISAFSFVANISLSAVRSTFAIIGSTLALADVARSMISKNEVKATDVIKIIENIIKIAGAFFMVYAGASFQLLACIAASTAAFCNLTRNVISPPAPQGPPDPALPKTA